MVFLAYDCSTNKKMEHNIAKIKTLDIQGHRGARGLSPENTIPSFLEAIDLGVSTIELDVVINKDKMAIVSHEPFFNHEISTLRNDKIIDEKNEKEYNIYKMTLEEIKSIDVGLKFHPRFPNQEKIACVKPTLDEAIEACEKYRLSKKIKLFNYNIELKFYNEEFNPDEKTFSSIVYEVIKKHKIQHRCNIQSFHHNTLNAFHTIAPEIRTAILVENLEEPTIHLKKLNHKPHSYSPYFKLVNDSLVSFLKNEKIKLIPWTVNELSEAQALVELGVDGIITDYPNIINNKTLRQNAEK